MAEIIDLASQHKCARTQCRCRLLDRNILQRLQFRTPHMNRRSKSSVTVSTLRVHLTDCRRHRSGLGG
jgi:hypothetical protein